MKGRIGRKELSSDFLEEIDNFSRKTKIVIPEEYGAIGDGVTDDTIALQKMFELCGDNTIIKLFADYKISYPLICKYSNIKIEANGHCLIYDNIKPLPNSNGSARYYGALNFVGENLSPNKINITKVETINSVDSSFLRLFTNTSSVKEDDYVYINVTSQRDWAKDFSDVQEGTNGLLKIYKRTETYIDVVHKTPYDVSSFTGTFSKIKPVHNITINNLNYLDKGEYIYNVGEASDVEEIRASWVSGIVFWRCVNINIDNFNSKGNKFPALFPKICNGYFVRNSSASKPGSVGPGCGYFTQVSSSTNIIIDNCYGEETRHLVDLSASSHAIIRNCKDLTHNNNYSFDCHGIYEHDVIYENCIGNFVIGNGINNFPMCTANITVVNCKFYNVKLKAVKNIIVRDCEYFGLALERDSHYIGNIEIYNSKIYGNAQRWYSYAKKRNSSYKLEIKIHNCEFIYTNRKINDSSLTSSLLGFSGYDIIDISNCTAKTELNKRTDIQLDSSYLYIRDCKFEDVFICAYGIDTRIRALYIKDNIFRNIAQIPTQTYTRAIITGDTIVSALILTGNRFLGSSDTSMDWILANSGAILTNSTIMLTNNQLTNANENVPTGWLDGESKILNTNNLLINYKGKVLK